MADTKAVHRSDPNCWLDRVVAVFRSQPDVVAVYLFGSTARGEATSRSDVDIAVLLAVSSDSPSESWSRQAILTEELRKIMGRPVDVVVLNRAHPLLCHRVLREGRLIYERDSAARIEFEVRAGKIYADLQPMWAFFHQALERELEEDRFGELRRSHPGKAAVASKRSRLSKKRKG